MVLFKSCFGGHLAGRIKLAAWLGCLLLACESPQVESVGDYYPLNANQKKIYEVVETQYLISGEIKKNHYYIKESISEININQDQSEGFVLEKYISSTQNGNWKLWTVENGKKYADRLQLKQNNVETVKLIFPVVEKSGWNLNLYNHLPAQKAYYSYILPRMLVGNASSYEKVAEVSSADDSTLISLKRDIQYFAPKIGEILHRTADLAYCQATPDCIGKGIVSYGNTKTYTLVSITNY